MFDWALNMLLAAHLQVLPIYKYASKAYLKPCPTSVAMIEAFYKNLWILTVKY